MHGTVECPKFFLTLIKKHKIKQVALEFPIIYQKEINQYFSGKRKLEDLSIFKDKAENHDGRASESIKKLIANLKKNKIKIYFIDSESDYLKRDYFMAKNLTRINGKVAFLCGNIHASKKVITFPGIFLIINKLLSLFKKGLKISNNEIKTTGSYLPKKETVSYKIIAINGGEFYNLVKKKIKLDVRFSDIKVKELPKITESLEEGYDYYYLINKFTFSN